MPPDDEQPRILTGSVYDPPEAPYPRLLVMRRWPRGIRKDAVDQWERDLGPEPPLLNAWRREEIDWPTFEARYRAQMQEHASLVGWAAGMAATTGVVLLCGSHPDEVCHRSILADLIREHLGDG